MTARRLSAGEIRETLVAGGLHQATADEIIGHIAAIEGEALVSRNQYVAACVEIKEYAMTVASLRAQVERLTSDFASVAEQGMAKMRRADEQKATIERLKMVLGKVRPRMEAEHANGFLGDEEYTVLEQVRAALAPAETSEAKPSPERPGVTKEIASVLNRYSQENGSNTPDFILSQYLLGCLAAFDTAVQQRETWYGRDPRPSMPFGLSAPSKCGTCGGEGEFVYDTCHPVTGHDTETFPCPTCTKPEGA